VLRQRVGSGVLQQRRDQTVGEVPRKIEVFRLDFLLAVFLDVADRHLAARTLDGHVERLGKRRAFLDEVIGY
jgi:hypothetical protein